MTPTPTERLLDLLSARDANVRRQGQGHTARCPAHDDRVNSLSLREGADGQVLLHCFAGCEVEQIAAALGLTMRDLFTDAGRGGRGPTPSFNGATAQHPPGCTLAQYADAKRIPVESLRAWGLSDLSYQGTPALRIPYRDRTGLEVAVRFRLRLEKGDAGDDRFRWKSGTKPCLYGRDRLDQARERGYLALVEGESDCHTLWLHNEPAVGVPGANLWRDGRDAPELDGISTIYLVVEPDQGGETLRAKLATSTVQDRVRLGPVGKMD